MTCVPHGPVAETMLSLMAFAARAGLPKPTTVPTAKPIENNGTLQLLPSTIASKRFKPYGRKNMSRP